MQGSKRGVVIAAVALVALLVVGFVAYNALGAGNAPQAQESEAAADTPQAEDKTSQDAGGDAEQDATQEPVMLADYDATVYNALGEPLTLTDIADGKPLVINFWATWCPYCVKEMPDYQQLYAEYGERVSFAFVDCTDGSRETQEKAAAWLADNGFDELPAYYDLDLDAHMKFGASSLPTTAVVSAEGEILTVTPGAIDPDLMRSALDSVL